MAFRVCNSASECFFFFFFLAGGKKSHRRLHLLAHLTGDVRLQSPREDLVNDAVAMVRIVCLFPIIIWKQKNVSINAKLICRLCSC